MSLVSARPADRPLYVLTPEAFTRVSPKFAALQRKAEAAGVPAPQLRASHVLYDVWTRGEGEKTFEYPAGSPHPGPAFVYHGRADRVEVWVDGHAPRLTGYTFVGRVEHLDDGNILAAAPGHELPAVYRTAGPVCQHCGLTRRRTDTFVLRCDADGTHRQIGRNCLADFVRSPDAADNLVLWASLWEAAARAVEAEQAVGGGTWRVPVAGVVEVAVAYARVFGWVSISRSQETGDVPSSRIVRDALFTVGRVHGLFTDDAFKAARESAEVKTRTAAVLEWVNDTLAGSADASLSNYESNLVVAFRQEYIESRHVGLVCSAVQAYQRWVDRARDSAEKAADRPPSAGHLGEVGERVTVEATVRKINGPYPGQFGDSYMVLLTASTGHELVWWTGESLDLEEGNTYYLRATVKAHDEYNGRPQTKVSRAVEIDEAAYVKATTPKKPRKTKGDVA